MLKKLRTWTKAKLETLANVDLMARLCMLSETRRKYIVNYVELAEGHMKIMHERLLLKNSAGAIESSKDYHRNMKKASSFGRKTFLEEIKKRNLKERL